VRLSQLPYGAIRALELSGAPMPNRFTGCWKGRHYYLGRHWLGPTNEVGNKRLRGGIKAHLAEVNP